MQSKQKGCVALQPPTYVLFGLEHKSLNLSKTPFRSSPRMIVRPALSERFWRRYGIAEAKV